MELYRRINWLFSYYGSVLDVLARWENLMEALQWCCVVAQRSPWAAPAPLQAEHSMAVLHYALPTTGIASQNGEGASMLMTGGHILLQATKSCKKQSELTISCCLEGLTCWPSLAGGTWRPCRGLLNKWVAASAGSCWDKSILGDLLLPSVYYFSPSPAGE